VPQRRACPKFATWSWILLPWKLSKLWTQLFDKWCTGKEVHVETVKALFSRQNSHENVFWKVYSLDLSYCIKLKIQGRTHSRKPSLNVERQVKLKWEDIRVSYSKAFQTKEFDHCGRWTLNVMLIVAWPLILGIFSTESFQDGDGARKWNFISVWRRTFGAKSSRLGADLKRLVFTVCRKRE